MPDPSTGLRGPCRKNDREEASEEDCPTYPCGLPRETDHDQQGDQGKDPSRIDEGRRDPGAACVLMKGGIARIIQGRLRGPINEGLPGRLAGLHDGRHGAGTEHDGEQTRCEGSPAVKEDPREHRERGHGESDDRRVIERQMKVGRGEEVGHGVGKGWGGLQVRPGNYFSSGGSGRFLICWAALR